MLESLADMMDFTYEFSNPEDLSWGSIDDGKWTGHVRKKQFVVQIAICIYVSSLSLIKLGYLWQGKVDLLIGAILTTSDRLKVSISTIVVAR